MARPGHREAWPGSAIGRPGQAQPKCLMQGHLLRSSSCFAGHRGAVNPRLGDVGQGPGCDVRLVLAGA